MPVDARIDQLGLGRDICANEDVPYCTVDIVGRVWLAVTAFNTVVPAIVGSAALLASISYVKVVRIQVPASMLACMYARRNQDTSA